MPGSVIVGGAARAPIGKLAASLRDFSAVDLGGIAIAAALQRAQYTGDQVNYLVRGTAEPGAGERT